MALHQVRDGGAFNKPIFYYFRWPIARWQIVVGEEMVHHIQDNIWLYMSAKLYSKQISKVTIENGGFLTKTKSPTM